jgi:hypothetical protein
MTIKLKNTINWRLIFQSRCAIDSCYDWINGNLTDDKLIRLIRGLKLSSEAEKMKKYMIKYNHKNLKGIMRGALKRYYC